jgi:hypothetical protein
MTDCPLVAHGRKLTTLQYWVKRNLPKRAISDDDIRNRIRQVWPGIFSEEDIELFTEQTVAYRRMLSRG